MLIVSIGQGGINPLRIYWEDNKEVLRKDGKKKKGGKGKAKVGGEREGEGGRGGLAD